MSRIARNMAALLFSQVASWGATLIAIVAAPRFLGDTQFGTLSFITYFVGFFGILANLGSAPFIAKMTARDPSVQGPYVFNALALKAPLCVVLSLIAVGIIWGMGYSTEMRLIAVAACLAMSFGVLTGALFAGLQGEQRMERSAVWSTVGQYVSTAAFLAALAARRGLLLVVLAPALARVIPLLANGAQLLPRLRASARIDLALWRVLVLGGLPFLVWDVALTIYGTVDSVMLSWMAGDAVVGWYAVAYKLVGIPAFLPSLIVTTFLPALAASGVRVTPEFIRLANRALCLVSLVCIPMAAGIALVASDVISLFQYPAGFVHSVPLIRILALHIPLVGIDTVMGAIIMANDRQKQWVIVGCLAAALNPLLNLLAIPAAAAAFGNAAVGASIVTVVTELFMLGGAIYLRPRGVLDRRTASFLARCTIAGGAMVAAVLVVHDASLPIRIALGVFVYGAASVALRTIAMRAAYGVALQLLRPADLRDAAGAL